MRFLPIVLGWIIAGSALSAIAAIPSNASDTSYTPPAYTTG